MKVLDHLELGCARTKDPLQKPTSCEGLPLTDNESDEDAPSEPSKHSDDSSEAGGEAKNNTQGETGVEDLSLVRRSPNRRFSIHRATHVTADFFQRGYTRNSCALRHVCLAEVPRPNMLRAS